MVVSGVFFQPIHKAGVTLCNLLKIYSTFYLLKYSDEYFMNKKSTPHILNHVLLTKLFTQFLSNYQFQLLSLRINRT